MRRLAFVLVLVACGTAHALHQESPGAIHLTSGPAHVPSPGRAWGNWVAFASTQDLAGLGAVRVAGSQVFVFNLDYYDCAHGTTFPTTPCPPASTPYLVQVTNGPGDPANPSVSRPPSGSTNEFDVWVAFDALGTYGGAGGGQASRRQIFMKQLATNEIRQVTAAADGDSERPSVSSLAGLVVFESTAMLAGFPNPAAVSQVFLYERGSNVLAQVSVGPPPGSVLGLGPSRNPMPNEGGTGLAFESTADLMGAGADTGVSQIFWADWDKQAHAVTLRRLTAGNGPSRNPFVGDAPKVVVFDSEATDLPGTSPEPGRSLFRIAIGDPPATTVDRLTGSSLFGDCSVPALDPGGTRLAFVCTGDPLQNATTGLRLFVLDQTTATLYQLTGLGSVTGRPAANLGQWFVTVATSSDLEASGPCTTQLHVVDYFSGHWAAATLLGQYPADVTGANACGGNCTTAADCDDGNPCNGVETCSPQGFCARGTPVVCSDGDVCNGVEACNPGTGTCTGGVPLVCNDGNPCTDDVCQPAVGCTATPNTASCDDGNPCTLGDACANGVCAGAPIACPTCQRCDPLTAACVVGPRAGCTGAGPGLKSTLRLRLAPLASGNLLVWKWRRPGAVADFGDPLTSTDYALCLYDGADGLVARSDAAGGATCGTSSCWRAKSSGFLYRDGTGTPTGLMRLLLRSKSGAGVKLGVKAKGANLALPSPASIGLPVRAQLQAGAGACWEGVYPTPAVQDATQLRAKLP